MYWAVERIDPTPKGDLPKFRLMEKNYSRFPYVSEDIEHVISSNEELLNIIVRLLNKVDDLENRVHYLEHPTKYED